VQVPRGPAAVNGDETRGCHCLGKLSVIAVSSQQKLKAES